jgi:acetyltransferase-like isoleucine patch superfamily enzyme
MNYVLDEGRTLEHLGEPVSGAPILNRPLADHQDDALDRPVRVRSLAEIPAEARDFLLVRDHVFLTRLIARRFAAAARASGAETAVLGLEPCVFARTTTALGGTRDDGGRTVYEVYWRRAGRPTPDDLTRATTIPLAIREHPIANEVLLRRGLSVEGLDVALTREAVLHVRHWSHLPVANYVALFAHWFDFTPARICRYLGAVLRAGWPSPARILRKLVVRGRRCKIHPSAVVEASVLGDGAEIGPLAIVRASFIGDGAKIDAHAQVNYSSIGPAAFVSFYTICNFCVLYPEAMLSLIGTQMGVIGRRATVLGGSLLMDVRDPYLERDVPVMDGGERVPSGRKVLGPCIGPDAVIGAGVRLAPGLAVPASAYLVGDPDAVVRRIDGALAPRAPHSTFAGAPKLAKKPGTY